MGFERIEKGDGDKISSWGSSQLTTERLTDLERAIDMSMTPSSYLPLAVADTLSRINCYYASIRSVLVQSEGYTKKNSETGKSVLDTIDERMSNLSTRVSDKMNYYQRNMDKGKGYKNKIDRALLTEVLLTYAELQQLKQSCGLGVMVKERNNVLKSLNTLLRGRTGGITK